MPRYARQGHGAESNLPPSSVLSSRLLGPDGATGKGRQVADKQKRHNRPKHSQYTAH